MHSRSRMVFFVFVVVMCSALLVTNGFGQTITLSPDPLNLETNSVGNMTATLSEPAAVGGLVLSLSATPGTSISVPPTVFIAQGEYSVIFDVVSGSVTGEELVTITNSGLIDSATVVIGLPSSVTSCKTAAGDADHAAQVYMKAVKYVGRICKNVGPPCATAVSQANASLNAVIQANQLMTTACQ